MLWLLLSQVADEIDGPAHVVQLATRKLSSSLLTKRSSSAADSRSLLDLLSQLASCSVASLIHLTTPLSVDSIDLSDRHHVSRRRAAARL